jgi:beta-N-acetylhexosaminidase
VTRRLPTRERGVAPAGEHGVVKRLPAAIAALTFLIVGTGLTADSSASSGAAAPTLAQMVGQRMLVAFHGTAPDAALLARIRGGQIGGVILFSENIRDATQLAGLTEQLQAAARAGGRPPLLIATDQEGGLVRRLWWAPPVASAEELGTTTTTHIARVGRRTGIALRAAGVNLDLAPVADVPRSDSNFLETEHRAFARSRDAVARDAAAFAQGLEAGGVLPTLKHFPGLGRAGATSTDEAVVRITASRERIVYDLKPYRVALARSLGPAIMLSTAVYPAYSSSAAAWSKPIARRLLRRDLGFRGVEMTDSLTAAAAVRRTTPAALAVRSARVGVDLLLVTGSEATSQAAYDAVLREARAGTIPLAQLEASYTRILDLKARI